MNLDRIPETDEEIDEFIRAVDAGEIECPPPPNAKLVARMCMMHSQIEKLEAESTRLHIRWHSAEERCNIAEAQREANGILAHDTAIENHALRAERDALAAWKAEAMAVESQWDVQAVGKMLKVPLGHPIHPAIEPGVRDLQEKLAITRAALESITHDMGANLLIHRLAAETLNQTAP